MSWPYVFHLCLIQSGHLVLSGSNARLQLPSEVPENSIVLLTHYILNRFLLHYTLEELSFNFRYVRLPDLGIPRDKWLNYLQSVQTLIKCHIRQNLILGCTVCQLPILGVSRQDELSN